MYRCNSLILIVTFAGGLLLQPAVQALATVSHHPLNLVLKKKVLQPAALLVPGFNIDHVAIVKSSAVTLKDLLQEQSLLHLNQTSGDNSQSSISLRGFGDNAAANSLIMVDGLPLLEPTLLAPNLAAIGLTDIKTLDIIPGSAGSLYGNQAVGGVVNIVTRQPDKPEADMSLGAGSYRQHVYSLWAADKWANGFNLKVFGVNQQTHNYRNHNQQANSQIAYQLGFDYSQGAVSFKQQHSTHHINFPGPLSEHQFNIDPRQATLTTNYAEDMADAYQLRQQHRFNPHWTVETLLSHQISQGGGYINQIFKRAQAIDTVKADVKGALAFAKITTGVSTVHSRYDFVSPLRQLQASLQQQNIYGQVHFLFNPQWEWVLGTRGAWQGNHTLVQQQAYPDSVDKVWVSEQGIVFKPMPNWRFYLRRDGNFRFSKADENAWVLNQATPLKVQTGVAYELGGQWQGFEHQLVFNLYQLRLKNELAFDPTPTTIQPLGYNRNLPLTLRQGFSITEHYQVNPQLKLKLQYNYVKARFVAGEHAGNSIPAVPAMTGLIGVQYQFLPHWQVQYDALYTGRRYASDDDGNVNGQLASYWLSNLSVAYRHLNWNISGAINNLFAKRYAVYTLFDDLSHTNSYYPGFGRNFVLAVKLHFG